MHCDCEWIHSVNYFFFQPCLRRASEWVIPEKFFKEAHGLFSTKSEKCTGVHDFRKILEVLGVHDFSIKSEKCVGVHDLGEILEVFGVCWECVISSTKSEKCVGSAWFQENAWSPRSALEVHSALLLRWWECIGSAWKCVGVGYQWQECVKSAHSNALLFSEGTYVFHANQWEVTKTRFFLISTIIADIWTKICLHIVITQ